MHTDSVLTIILSLAKERGWHLCSFGRTDAVEDLFINNVRRTLEQWEDQPAGRNQIAYNLQRAVIYEYNKLLYAAIGQQGTTAQERALIEIWNYVTPLIRKIVRDDDLAHDVAMDVLIKVCERRDQVRDPGCFLAWAAVIARRAALQAVRRAGREVPVSDLIPEGEEEGAEENQEEYLGRLKEGTDGLPPPEPNGAMRIAELEARIRECLRRMRHAAEVFIGLVLHDLSVAELAGKLGMKPGAIYVIFHRARLRLRQCGPLLADLGVALEATP